MPDLTLSPPPLPSRPSPNALHAFSGVSRLAFRRASAPGQLLAFAGAAALVAGLAYLAARGGNSRHFLDWLRDFQVCVLIPALSFVSGAGALRDDLKPSNVDYVFSRPLPRWQYVFFKYVSHLVVLQVAYFALLLVSMSVGRAMGLAGVFPSFGSFLFSQFLLVTTAVGMGFFVGALTARYVIVGIVYGSMIEAGIGSIPTLLNRLSMIRRAKLLLDSPTAAEAFSAGSTLIIVAGAAVCVAALLIHLREFTGERSHDA